MSDIERRKPTERTAHAAVNMRIAAAPYEKIAEVLAYSSPSAARAAVEEQLAGMYEVEDRKSLFQIVSARYDTLIASLHPQATSAYVQDQDDYGPKIDDEGNPIMVPNPNHLSYARTYADVLSRFSKLHGLDAPTQVQVTPGGDEFNQVVAAMVDKALADAPREADLFADEFIEDAVIVEPGELDAEP
jgi:hypothetical protein